jgi:hypothetical protein
MRWKGIPNKGRPLELRISFKRLIKPANTGALADVPSVQKYLAKTTKKSRRWKGGRRGAEGGQKEGRRRAEGERKEGGRRSYQQS